MDILKAKLTTDDTAGYLTLNEAKTFDVTLYNGDTKEALSALTGPSWETVFLAEDGGLVTVATGSHSVIDDGIDAAKLGVVRVTMTLAQVKRIRRGKKVNFTVKLTQTTPSVKTYWGQVDEVREPLA